LAADGLTETPREVSEHLSECVACRGIHADLLRMEEVLAGTRRWLDDACRDVSSPGAIPLVETVPLTRGQVCWLRAAFAGASLLLIVAVAVLLFRSDKEPGRRALVSPEPRALIVTRDIASAASSCILHNLAEVELRHEAPPPRFPDGPRTLPPEPRLPRLLEKSLSDSERILIKMADSQTNLIRRKES
jgi:hypothetical protein